MEVTLDFDSSHLGGRPNNLNNYNSSIYLVKSARKGLEKAISRLQLY